MRLLLFITLITLSSITWAADINFAGVLSVEVCPKNSGCFPNHVGISPTVSLTNIYEDADTVVDIGEWEETQTIQNKEITGNLEITKTVYKATNEVYWEYVVTVSNGKNEAKTSYSVREPTKFWGVLTTKTQNVAKKGKPKSFPLMIVAPEGFKFHPSLQIKQ